MQADFSLEDHTTFQQVLPIKTGRKAKRGREGVGGKKSPTKTETDATSTPLSSKLLHEKVYTCTPGGLLVEGWSVSVPVY